MSKGLDVAKNSLEKWTGKEREELVLLGGGTLIARTGMRGGGCEREEGEMRIRRSKNEKVNWKGRKLIEFEEENGWEIFNGCIRGDEEGEYSFTGEEGEHSDRLRDRGFGG